MQSDEEIRHICDEWFRNFLPTVAPRLILSAENGRKISERSLQKGYVSISYLTESYRELAAAGQLTLTPEPKVLTPVVKTAAQIQQEQAEKGERKMRQDFLNSLKPYHVVEAAQINSENAAEKKRESLVKELKSIHSQIESEISGYLASHPSALNAPDYARTEYGRVELRRIRDSHNRSTVPLAKAALLAVRAAKSKL